jgi:hypothetical protein
MYCMEAIRTLRKCKLYTVLNCMPLNFPCNERQSIAPYESFIDEFIFLRMASSGMLRRVALVKTDVSEKLSVYIVRVRRIGELGTLA